MKGIIEPNEKEVAALASEIKFNTMKPERPTPTNCPKCNSVKLVKSRMYTEKVLGERIYVRTLKCKACNFINVIEE